MPYLKHPELGNKHVGDEEAGALEAQGWERFPRSKEAKAAWPWPPLPTPKEQAPENSFTVTGVGPLASLPMNAFDSVAVPDAPIKRKPGRPKKSA